MDDKTTNRSIVATSAFPTFLANFQQNTLSSLDVKVHGYHISSLNWREKVITDNDTTSIDVDCHGNSVLVHDIPLLIISIYTIQQMLHTMRELTVATL